MARRLESEVIPALADGEEKEVVNAMDWIIRRAISKRVGNFREEEEWEKDQGTERVGARSRM